MSLYIDRILSFFKYAVTIILILIVVLPILWIVLVSFQKPIDIVTWPPVILSMGF